METKLKERSRPTCKAVRPVAVAAVMCLIGADAFAIESVVRAASFVVTLMRKGLPTDMALTLGVDLAAASVVDVLMALAWLSQFEGARRILARPEDVREQLARHLKGQVIDAVAQDVDYAIEAFDEGRALSPPRDRSLQVSRIRAFKMFA